MEALRRLPAYCELRGRDTTNQVGVCCGERSYLWEEKLFVVTVLAAAHSRVANCSVGESVCVCVCVCVRDWRRHYGVDITVCVPTLAGGHVV